jgi:hypothetical protein
MPRTPEIWMAALYRQSKRQLARQHHGNEFAEVENSHNSRGRDISHCITILCRMFNMCVVLFNMRIVQYACCSKRVRLVTLPCIGRRVLEQPQLLHIYLLTMVLVTIVSRAQLAWSGGRRQLVL